MCVPCSIPCWTGSNLQQEGSWTPRSHSLEIPRQGLWTELCLCQAAKIRWQEQGVAVGCEPLLSKSSLQKTNLLLIMQFCLQCLCEQGVRYKLERDKLINLGSLWCLDSLFSLITGSRAASTWSGCYSSNCCGERQSSQDWCVKGS